MKNSKNVLLLGKKKLILIASLSALIIVAIVTYAVLFGTQTIVVLTAGKPMKQNPILDSIPVRLDLGDKAFNTIKTVSHFGYRFEIPWTDVNEVTKKEDYVKVSFSSGKVVFISSPEVAPDIVEGLKNKIPDKSQQVNLLIGAESLISDYEFYEKMLNVRPKDVSLFKSRREVLQAYFFLIMKDLVSAGAESGLFSFTHGGFRGFQFGLPLAPTVKLSIFDTNDRHLQLQLFVPKGRQTTLSQEEINHKILTLQLSSKESESS